MKCSKDILDYGFIWDAILHAYAHKTVTWQQIDMTDEMAVVDFSSRTWVATKKQVIKNIKYV